MTACKYIITILCCLPMTPLASLYHSTNNPKNQFSLMVYVQLSPSLRVQQKLSRRMPPTSSNPVPLPTLNLNLSISLQYVYFPINSHRPNLLSYTILETNSANTTQISSSSILCPLQALFLP